MQKTDTDILSRMNSIKTVSWTYVVIASFTSGNNVSLILTCIVRVRQDMCSFTVPL